MKISNVWVTVSVAAFLIVFIGLVVALVSWSPGQSKNLLLASGNSQFAAAIAADLSSAADFAVLAGSGITDTNPSVISGDVGLSPTTGAAIGLTAAEVTGTIYDVDGAGPAGSVMDSDLLTLAKNALTSAYNNALGQTTDFVIAADLGGQTLTPGVYEDNDAPDSLSITGTLTLDAEGDPDAVFIFKTGSTLTTAVGSSVTLINGAQACNVFWQVGSSATLGTGSDFKGNLLALTSITDNGGSTVEGRLLAQNGAVTLNNTSVTKATCVTPPPPPAPEVSSVSGGGDYFAPLPLINVTKVPTPLALPSGPGEVTYEYIVTNVGLVAMGGIWIKDNKCSSTIYLSGDTDDNSLLDLTESWLYRCTKNVAVTETNTVTAHGSANGWDGYDTANATVVVGAALPPPLIHLVKKPSEFVLPAGGGAVTYTYTVTNPGTVPLSNVSITDDKCTGLPGRVTGHPGDVNGNDLLENSETWSFTCQTNITQTTTNIGTAEGHANGLTAIDFSPATVFVADPALPNTGLPFRGESIPWNIVVLGGLLVAALVSLIAALQYARRVA